MTGNEMLTIIVTAVLSSSVIAAIINYLSNRHKPKVDQQSADNADKKLQDDRDNALVDQLQEENSRLRTEREKWGKELSIIRKEFHDQISSLVVRVSHLEISEESNRRWIRSAAPLIEEYVPPERRIAPPPWFMTH